MTENRVLTWLMIVYFSIALVNEWRRLGAPPLRVLPFPALES